MEWVVDSGCKYSPLDIRIIFRLDPSLIFPLLLGPPFPNTLRVVSAALQCFEASLLEREALLSPLLDRETAQVLDLDWMGVRTEIVDGSEVLALRQPAKLTGLNMGVEEVEMA